MATKVRRKHRARGDDPLVPINGPKLKAAIRAAGLNPNQTAAKVAVSQQRLFHMTSGKVRKCHLSVRDKLAEFLDVPSWWLGDEPHPAISDRTPRLLSELVGPENVHIVEERTEPPPLSFLIRARMSNLLTRLFSRDESRGVMSSSKAFELSGASSAFVVGMEPFMWRQWLLEENQEVLTDAENDEATEALAKALTIILRPWLEGRAQLRYDKLHQLLLTATDPRA